MLADDPIGDFLVGVFVGDPDRGSEADDLALELADVDDLGASDQVLEVGDSAFDERLALPRRVILRVLGEVVVSRPSKTC